MDADQVKPYSKGYENDALFKKICFKTGVEIARFIYESLGNTELHGLPYWLVDRDTLRDENESASEMVLDFRNISGISTQIEHFRAVNGMLAANGVFIGCFESRKNWHNSVLKKHSRVVAYFILMANYVYRNFAPRLKKKNGTKSYSPASWNGNYSLAEVLGRLVYCGFEIINYKQNDQLTYFIVRKKSGPRSELVSVSRFIVRLIRVGKSGRIVDIYKIRSMYPYSEFLQDYVIKINGYNIMGKPKNDFRLTSCGRIIRKLWIDEIPQIYNLLKGDISLVGVRPISRYGFNALPADLQDKRIKNKPGLISPHVSLRFQGFDGVIRAERKYLEEREISPVKTNIRYFLLAVFNILTLRVKSS